MLTSTGASLITTAISISTSGDNTIIAAQTRPIAIHRIKFLCAAPVSITFKAGSRSLSGAEYCTTQVLDYAEVPWYSCEVGEAFIMSLSSSVAVGGSVWYQVGD